MVSSVKFGLFEYVLAYLYTSNCMYGDKVSEQMHTGRDDERTEDSVGLAIFLCRVGPDQGTEVEILDLLLVPVHCVEHASSEQP